MSFFSDQNLLSKAFHNCKGISDAIKRSVLFWKDASNLHLALQSCCNGTKNRNLKNSTRKGLVRYICWAPFTEMWLIIKTEWQYQRSTRYNEYDWTQRKSWQFRAVQCSLPTKRVFPLSFYRNWRAKAVTLSQGRLVWLWKLEKCYWMPIVRV